MKAITRKEFLATGAAMVAGLALGTGCAGGGDEDPAPGGDDDDDGQTGTPTPTPTGTATPTGTPTPTPTPVPNCLMNGTTVMIGGNHGHVLVVTKEEVAAGADKTYGIQGSSGHTHNVTVTAAMFTTLQGNTQVSTVSDMGNSMHTHNITVICA